MACYRNGGCGPYEMYSCSECPASKPEFIQRQTSYLENEQVRLIDANALTKKIQFLIRIQHRDIFDALNEIDDAPTIDPESFRPLGVWIGEADGYADGELVYDVWYCSECNYCIDDGTDDPDLLPKFCPECGAKMSVVTDCTEEVENLE